MGLCDACGADVDTVSRFCGECGAVVRPSTREEAIDVRAGTAKARTVPGGKAGRSKEVRETVKEGKGRVTKAAERPPEVKPTAPAKELRSTIRGIATPPPPPTVGLAEPMSVKHPPAKSVSDSALPPALRSAPPAALGDSASPPENRTEFQRLLDEVESGFDAILVTGETSPPAPRKVDLDEDTSETSENQFDQTQAKELFRELVVANAQPIRDFMIEARLGEPHPAWLDYCSPAVMAILRSAEGMGLGELVGKIRRFIGSMEKSRSLLGSIPAIRGEGREGLIDAYSDLISFFPDAFGAEADSNKRESVIVRALLSKVPGLNPLAVGRIYGTGMASLGLFYVSRPREIAELAGVSLEIAERIVERFAEYRRTASELSPARSRAEERARLKRAAMELDRSTRAYDSAPPVSAERRVHRRERLLAMADVSILSARLGEIERLRRIETMAFAARVEAILAFVEESERRALAEQRAR